MGVGTLPILADDGGTTTEAVADHEWGLLLKALYTSKLETFSASKGITPEEAAKPIVSKMAEQGIAMKIKMVGGLKEKPVVLTKEISLISCSCLEAIEQICLASGCEYDLIDKTVRFMYFNRKIRSSFKVEHDFAVSGKSGLAYNKQTRHWEYDGTSFGDFPEGCSMSYSIPNELITVWHHPLMIARIKKTLKENYWAWQKTQHKDQKVSAKETLENKLSVMPIPPMRELFEKECSVRVFIDFLNVIVAESGIKIVLHKELNSEQRFCLQSSTGGYADEVLSKMCTAINASYKARKDTITICPNAGNLLPGSMIKKIYKDVEEGFFYNSEGKFSPKESLQRMGVPFNEGASVTYNDKKKNLTVVNTVEAHEAINEAVELFNKNKAKERAIGKECTIDFIDACKLISGKPDKKATLYVFIAISEKDVSFAEELDFNGLSLFNGDKKAYKAYVKAIAELQKVKGVEVVLLTEEGCDVKKMKKMAKMFKLKAPLLACDSSLASQNDIDFIPGGTVVIKERSGNVVKVNDSLSREFIASSSSCEDCLDAIRNWMKENGD